VLAAIQISYNVYVSPAGKRLRKRVGFEQLCGHIPSPPPRPKFLRRPSADSLSDEQEFTEENVNFSRFKAQVKQDVIALEGFYLEAKVNEAKLHELEAELQRERREALVLSDRLHEYERMHALHDIGAQDSALANTVMNAAAAVRRQSEGGALRLSRARLTFGPRRSDLSGPRKSDLSHESTLGSSNNAQAVEPRDDSDDVEANAVINVRGGRASAVALRELSDLKESSASAATAPMRAQVRPSSPTLMHGDDGGGGGGKETTPYMFDFSRRAGSS